MSVLFVVLPLALLLSSLSVLAFVWGARRGQFDDLTTPGYQPLLDDPAAPSKARSRLQSGRQEPP